MRFMMMVKGTKDSEAGVPPAPELIARMEALIQEMAQAGVLESCEGLLPSSQGMLLQCVDGKRRVIDGPFSEAKEVIGGFAILKAASKSEALALANRMIDVHVASGVRNTEIEIRLMFDPEMAGG